MFQNNDIGKFVLRFLVGAMMLFHGVEKMINGISGIKSLVSNAGLPEFFAYGVYVGEVIIPIFIILGLYARMASLVLAINMAIAIFLAYGSSIFTLGKYGTPIIELPLFYLVLSLVIFFLGSGKYAVNNK